MHAQAAEQILFNFLILEKSRFPPKKFYNINYWSQHGLHGPLSKMIFKPMLADWKQFPLFLLLIPDPDLELVHVRRAQRNRHPLLPLHAQDVHRALPPWEVREGGTRQQANAEANPVGWSKYPHPNIVGNQCDQQKIAKCL